MLTPEYKKRKLEEARDYHQGLIDELGLTRDNFQIKMLFYNKGIQVVGIFASEFRKEKGLYFEFVDRDLQPVDANRIVYKVSFSDSYIDEYPVTEKGSYMVPVDELRAVSDIAVAINGKSAVPEQSFKDAGLKPPTPAPIQKPQDSLEDERFSEMTIRDYVAIMTGNPVSKREWLNTLITSIK